MQKSSPDLTTVPEKHSLDTAVDYLIAKFEEFEIEGEPIDFVIPAASQFYDNARPELKALFEGLDFARVRSITLSANSYGTEACQWIADEILSKCLNLKKVNFSDMFTQRLRSDLPNSLKALMDSIMNRKIEHLDLSHNAFGPDGVKSFQDFLSKCPSLKLLNVTNCGLGPKGGEMIAEAIEKNPSMKLTEFYASRDRLEQEGL